MNSALSNKEYSRLCLKPSCVFYVLKSYRIYCKMHYVSYLHIATGVHGYHRRASDPTSISSHYCSGKNKKKMHFVPKTNISVPLLCSVCCRLLNQSKSTTAVHTAQRLCFLLRLHHRPSVVSLLRLCFILTSQRRSVKSHSM